MTWQKRHDIILNWIDSCKTPSQLENMLQFVGKQNFDKGSLLRFVQLKAYQLQANIIVNSMEAIVKILKR